MIQIGVAAYSGRPDPVHVEKAKRVIGGIAEKLENVAFVLGGYRGLMRIAVDEGLKRGSRVILVLPREYEGDIVPEECILVKTGMDFKTRSCILLRSCSILVALGGASGTLMEIVTAIGLGINVFQLVNTGLPTDELMKAYPTGMIDPILKSRIRYFADPNMLVKEAVDFLRKSN